MGENFIGLGKDQIIFEGHGVGLELDEFPVLLKSFPADLR